MLFFKSTILAASALLALCAPGVNAQNPTIKLGGKDTITGVNDGNVEVFKGIPFAEPPVGDLRFKRPVPYSKSLNNYQATKFSKSCLIINPGGLVNVIDTALNPLKPLIADKAPLIANLLTNLDTDEDCLYLNVYKPKNIPPGTKLPVMFWIYGGAFFFGNAPTYDGARFVKASEKMNQPVIVVTANYRLGPWGFLGGPGILQEKNGNAGLHDQRLALKWVSDHIEDFGGDPTKVTIFGESAGAMSVYAQMAAYDGNNNYNGKPLFRGAIMQSGSILPQEYLNDTKPTRLYERFAKEAGCLNGDPAAVMSCLRSKPVDVLVRAQNSFSLIPENLGIVDMFVGWSPRADGDFLTDAPHRLADQGRIANVPFIIGTQEDEGSMFSFLFTSFTPASTLRICSELFEKATTLQVASILSFYPNLLSAGSPFRTGVLNAVTPQFKRLGAFLTDLLFNSGRRRLLFATEGKVDRWNYFSSTLYGVVPLLGTFHANDIIWQWFVDIGPFKVYQNYFIAFANHLNPNTGSGLRQWPKYSTASKSTLEVTMNRLGTTVDNFREAAIGHIIDNPTQVSLKKRAEEGDPIAGQVIDELVETLDELLETEKKLDRV